MSEQTQTVKRRLFNVSEIIPGTQLRVVRKLMKGEEGAWFKAKVCEILAIADAMPRSYETDGQGERAMARLHYFAGGRDWWITELDSDEDDEGQVQAFGMVDIGNGPECGYINLVEVCASNVELDLHWTPTTLAEIKAKR
jgi:hypothetical protein